MATTLKDAEELADWNNPLPEDFCIAADGSVKWKPGREPKKCLGCDMNFADLPSMYCPGCIAYKDHQ